MENSAFTVWTGLWALKALSASAFHSQAQDLTFRASLPQSKVSLVSQSL